MDKLTKLVSGKRKRSVASIKMISGTGKITVNGKDIKQYFPAASIIIDVYQPLMITKNLDKYDVIAKITGGGFTGQASALRLAIAKSLLNINEDYKKILKQEKLLTRDSRVKERKKYGLRKARRAPQFSKR